MSFESSSISSSFFLSSINNGFLKVIAKAEGKVHFAGNTGSTHRFRSLGPLFRLLYNNLFSVMRLFLVACISILLNLFEFWYRRRG